ncbi:hypothetical protein McpSp1_15240 [Methanocorpusculaceae archaeon Sp1]|uniref:DUF4276 domain-containing protein n=1 Tax=Methanorbis furvi TaxID=3028299 RepID=A0AAE4S981_9EURY|nr:hypothetical protein [Methanocorpusculaceae archaeon Sp1]MDV0441497.1 hypothetical protein [Methanocorpusculaceae archaeon Ag1]
MTLLLKIHVEGFTEASFAAHILRPYLEGLGCSITVVINKTSNAHGVAHRGGLSHYEQFRINTRRLLKNKNAVVTTMIDYYGLPADFPGMGNISDYPTSYERVRYLERMLDENISGEDVPDDNFIPYIQLHEFEALLFSDIAAIDKVLSVGRSSHCKELREIRRNFEPEEINTSPESAPSKRLKRLYPRYSKTVEGILIAEKIGLADIRRQCPHFNEWLTEVERVVAIKGVCAVDHV